MQLLKTRKYIAFAKENHLFREYHVGRKELHVSYSWKLNTYLLLHRCPTNYGKQVFDNELHFLHTWLLQHPQVWEYHRSSITHVTQSSTDHNRWGRLDSVVVEWTAGLHFLHRCPVRVLIREFNLTTKSMLTGNGYERAMEEALWFAETLAADVEKYVYCNVSSASDFEWRRRANKQQDRVTAVRPVMVYRLTNPVCIDANNPVYHRVTDMFDMHRVNASWEGHTREEVIKECALVLGLPEDLVEMTFLGRKGSVFLNQRLRNFVRGLAKERRDVYSLDVETLYWKACEYTRDAIHYLRTVSVETLMLVNLFRLVLT